MDFCRELFPVLLNCSNDGEILKIYEEFIAGNIFPIFLKGSESFSTTFEPRFVSLASPISLPLHTSIFNDVEFHIAQILMQYFLGLDGMYWRNGQRPQNVSSCLFTVRFALGTNAFKRDSFQTSSTFLIDHNLSGNLPDCRAAASSNPRKRNMP